MGGSPNGGSPNGGSPNGGSPVRVVKMVVDRPGVDQLFIAGYANLVPIVLLG